MERSDGGQLSVGFLEKRRREAEENANYENDRQSEERGVKPARSRH